MSRYLTLLARLVLASSALFLLPAFAAAQTPTGTISGRVIDSNGGVILGASVSIASPALQGTQTRVTTENGDYIFRALPPGLYTVTVESMGFAKMDQSVRVAPSEMATLNVTLQPATVTESVSVITSDDRSFVNTVQAAANLDYQLIRTLPTARTLESYINLAPGAHSTGPDGNITISGAMSFENLFMVNGAVISDNIRSEPLRLYVEDALQEVTVATSGISAEYGRFTGGVVNAVTKSGGNMFSGTFRSEFNNDDWRTVSPFGEPKADKLSPAHSFTFGGPIRRRPHLVLWRRPVREPRNCRAHGGDPRSLHRNARAAAIRRQADSRSGELAAPSDRLSRHQSGRLRHQRRRRSAPM